MWLVKDTHCLMKEEKDIEALKNEIERLKKLVYYDELTGLLNRRGFFEEVGNIFNKISYKHSEIERRIGMQIPFSIIFLDVDDFKKINDTYGHEVGDIVLKRIAQIIKNNFRVGDICVRWGGEEFVIALSGAGLDVAQKNAEILRQEVENTKLKINGHDLSTTISLGIIEDENETLTDLLEKADKAMYKAKSRGKNRIEIFTQD